MTCCGRRLGSLVAFVNVAVAASGARADPSTVPLPELHLAYVVTGNPESCPDEATFRRQVALRLGYDPFVPDDRPVGRRLSVRVNESAPRSVAVALTDQTGKVLGRRLIEAPPVACDELVANAAFAASVAIDPSVLMRPPVDAATKTATDPPDPSFPVLPAAPPSAAEPSHEAPPRPPSTDTRGFVPSLRVGGSGAFGVLPSAAIGVGGGGALQAGAVSLGLEGRFDFPSDSKRSVATLRASLVSAALSSCGHLHRGRIVAHACAVVWAGALRGAARGIASPKQDVTAYIAAGPRLGVAFFVTETFALDLRVDVPFALTAAELRVDGRGVWTAPTVSAVAGFGASRAFP